METTEIKSEGPSLAEQARAEESRPKTRKNKPGAGRPKGPSQKAEKIDAGPQSSSSAEEREASIKQTQAMVLPIIHAVSSLGVAVAGHPSAAMNPAQIESCSYATAGILEKYLPLWGDKYGAEIIFAMAFGGYAMHVNTVRLQVKKVEAQKAAAQAYQPPAKQESKDPRETEQGFTGPDVSATM